MSIQTTQNNNNGELATLTDALEKTWEVDGQTYTMTPLRIRQWARIEEWVRQQPLRRAKEETELMPPEFAKEVWQEARAESRKISMTNPDFMQKLLNFGGLQLMFWMSVVRKHPEISEAKAGDLFQAERGGEFQEYFMELNRTIIQSPGGGGPNPPVGAAATP